MKVLMIDPPSGWKYGFPKPAPKVGDLNDQWWIDNGYPEDKLDDITRFRYFETEVDDE